MLRQYSLAKKLPGRDRQAGQCGDQSCRRSEQQGIKPSGMEISLYRIAVDQISQSVKYHRGDHQSDWEMRTATVQISPEFFQMYLAFTRIFLRRFNGGNRFRRFTCRSPWLDLIRCAV